MTMPDPTPDPAVLSEARAREVANSLRVQASCLERYAEGEGYTAKPVPSVFHLQASHFRDLADHLTATPPASDTPASGAERDAPQGTFACPICGKDTPHYHSPEEVQRHREDEAWVEESWQQARVLFFPDSAAAPTVASEVAGLLRESANLAGRIEAAGGLVDEGANFERWKATARDLAPRLREALTHPAPSAASGEALARRFHEAYERLAPSFGYETRADTKAFDPETANGKLMIAVCSELATTPGGDLLEQAAIVEEWKREKQDWHGNTSLIDRTIRALSPARDGAGS